MVLASLGTIPASETVFDVEVFRKLSVEGFPVEDRLACFEVVPARFRSFNFGSQYLSTESAEELKKELELAAGIVKAFIVSHHLCRKSMPPKDQIVLGLS